ncbi:MAG: hypothetical protein K2L15_00745 [Eubacteriales bacterium]|nr:hypothetical protein [Eubacteriales bacterium]
MSETQNILNENCILDNYSSSGKGCKFNSNDGMIYYHLGGGRHFGSYYGFSTGKTGKVKIVSNEYIPTPDNKATVIYFYGDD